MMTFHFLAQIPFRASCHAPASLSGRRPTVQHNVFMQSYSFSVDQTDVGHHSEQNRSLLAARSAITVSSSLP